MSKKEILKKALKLNPQDKYFIIEGLIQSLDEPNKEIKIIWAIEAEKRLDSYRKGKLEAVPMSDIF